MLLGSLWTYDVPVRPFKNTRLRVSCTSAEALGHIDLAGTSHHRLDRRVGTTRVSRQAMCVCGHPHSDHWLKGLRSELRFGTSHHRHVHAQASQRAFYEMLAVLILCACVDGGVPAVIPESIQRQWM